MSEMIPGLNELAGITVKVTREYIASEMKILQDRLKTLEDLITEIPAGPKGDKGDPGERGEIGPAGAIGPQGERGEKGDRGPMGPEGIAIPGPTGPKGELGKPGEKGDRGDIGPIGLQGPIGLPGRDGINGKDGESVHPDTVALLIAKAVAKAVSEIPKAKDGIDGKNGRDGEPGRDAIQMDIFEFEDSKSVPRGTCVHYRGGVFRAKLKTSVGSFKSEEWELLCNGIAEITINQNEDLRSFTVSIEKTVGAYSRVFSLPVVIYQDIFQKGTSYVRGDAVTWDNSTWHCQVEKTTSIPGTNADWRMMARKGGEGKKGMDGAVGPQGPAGKDGRDLTRIGSR